MKIPRYIGLCGDPQVGKSEVQRILWERFGVVSVDDGWPLRDFAMRHLGLSHDDVLTQAGKRRSSIINGREWENRKTLGDLGVALENLFGGDVMHWMATRTLPATGSYCFGSVRRNAAGIKRDGGVIVEIVNPSAPPRRHAFDAFDRSLIDVTINNDAQSRGMERDAGLADLEAKVCAAIAAVSDYAVTA